MPSHRVDFRRYETGNENKEREDRAPRNKFEKRFIFPNGGSSSSRTYDDTLTDLAIWRRAVVEKTLRKKSNSTLFTAGERHATEYQQSSRNMPDQYTGVYSRSVASVARVASWKTHRPTTVGTLPARFNRISSRIRENLADIASGGETIAKSQHRLNETRKYKTLQQ